MASDKFRHLFQWRHTRETPFLDSFEPKMTPPGERALMPLQLQLVVSISISVRSWLMHRQVCLLLTQWDFRGLVSKVPNRVHDLKCTIDSRKDVFFVALWLFSLFLDGENNYSLSLFTVYMFWLTHRGEPRRCQWQCGSTLSFSNLLRLPLCNFITMIIPLTCLLSAPQALPRAM